MFRFQLRSRDLRDRWHADGAAWRAGSSRIEPFVHRRLHLDVLTTARRTAFLTRERNTGLPEPTNRAVAVELSESAFDRRIAEALAWDLEFAVLLIAAGGDAPSVSLRCGAWGTAPVYLLHVNDTLHGDWDVTRLYARLPSPALDPAFVASYLVELDHPYCKETIFPAISHVTERAEARWEPPYARVQIVYPPAQACALPSPLKAGADVAGMFRTILRASMQRWIEPDDAAVALELSGGLDSTLVAATAASLTSARVRSYGLTMPGMPGTWQQRRRAEIIARFGLADRTIPCIAYPPFTQRHEHATVPWDEFYVEAMDRLLTLARDDGMDTIFTGAGGDELCTIDAHERPAVAAAIAGAAVRVPFFTRQTIDAFEQRDALLQLAPQSVRHTTALEGNAAASRLYLSHGMWPVSPLTTPELVEFCRRLPYDFRNGRTIQRLALTAFGLGPAVAYANPGELEDFGGVMTFALTDGASDVIIPLMRDSRLAEAGYVDREALLASYAAHQAGDATYADELLAVIVLELTVRAVEARRNGPSEVPLL